MLVASNPFFSAFTSSDLFGKLIFVLLFGISIVSWCVLLYKARLLRAMRQQATRVCKAFRDKKQEPLNFQPPGKGPFTQIYTTLRQGAIEILEKNAYYADQEGDGGKPTYLSADDVSMLTAHVENVIASQSRKLDSKLFILSTSVSLAPFLGLLGTVWGSLLTLAALQSAGSVANSSGVLEGLSMALATTVLGLVVAIPALIGHNVLKAMARGLTSEMYDFGAQSLAAIEINYRRVDLG